MTTLTGGFIYPDVCNLRMVSLLPALINIMVNNAPYAGVILVNKWSNRFDRHWFYQGHDHGLKQESKPAVTPSPWKLVNQPDATLWAIYSGNSGCQVSFMLKKFRCRQDFSTVSYAFNSALLHSGQENVLPRGKSILISRRFCSRLNSEEETCHGDDKPRANWKSSISLIMGLQVSFLTIH